MNTKEKIELIKRNTTEIMGENQLEDLVTKNKSPSVYLGTAITGSPHIGYFTWALKLADFARAGFKVKILLADVHGALDNTPWEILSKRYEYYKKIIPLLFESLGIDKKPEFIKGSSFQLKEDYILDLMKLATYVSVHDATKSASEVVKLGDNPKLGGLIYPLMQVIDEEYLKIDVQYGGNDQRKIFALASDTIEKLGYKKRIHVMTPIIPGLVGKKMSSSIQASKIDLLDKKEDIEKKVRNAECAQGEVENGVVSFIKYVIFPHKKDINQKLVIKRSERFGGPIHYSEYSKFEEDIKSKKLHPLDIKDALSEEIIKLLDPIEKNRKSLEKLYFDAYPKL